MVQLKSWLSNTLKIHVFIQLDRAKRLDEHVSRHCDVDKYWTAFHTLLDKEFTHE